MSGKRFTTRTKERRHEKRQGGPLQEEETVESKSFDTYRKVQNGLY